MGIVQLPRLEMYWQNFHSANINFWYIMLWAETIFNKYTSSYSLPTILSNHL